MTVVHLLTDDPQTVNRSFTSKSVFLGYLPESSTEETGDKQPWEPGQIPEYIHHKVQHHLHKETEDQDHRPKEYQIIKTLYSREIDSSPVTLKDEQVLQG